MKNVHILSTDKPIKNIGDLVKNQYGDIHIFTKNDGKEYIAAEYYNGAYIEGIERKEGYFFTPEELNQHISNVIKDALDIGAETQKETCICNQESCVCSDKSNYIMQSITNTFDITFQKYKV